MSDTNKTKQRIEEVVAELKKDVDTLQEAVTLLGEASHDFSKQIKSLESSVRSFHEDYLVTKSSVVYLENTVNAYADAYKANFDKDQILEKRLKKVEIKVGLRSPADSL